MSYTRNVPLASQTLQATQQTINNNFLQLDDIFDIDHIKYSATIGGGAGKHRKLTMVQFTGAPTISTNTNAIIYTNTEDLGIPTPGLRYTVKPGATAFVYKIPITISLRLVLPNIYPTPYTILDFTNYPKMTGTVSLVEAGSEYNSLFSVFTWNGATLKFSSTTGQLSSDPSVFKAFRPTSTTTSNIATLETGVSKNGTTIVVNFTGVLYT